MAQAGYWNHNVHYQPFILAAGSPSSAWRPISRSPTCSPPRPPSRLTGSTAPSVTGGESGAPIMDPQMTWREVRIEAARLLPGARSRRRLLWRYSLLWRKPGA